MGQKITVVDAFTEKPFAGNPAAVCILPASRPDAWMRNLARGVNLLVAECSGDASHPASGHLTAPEVGRLASEAGVGQLVLTHLYPLPDDRVRLTEVSDHYDGPVMLATDGTRFEV